MTTLVPDGNKATSGVLGSGSLWSGVSIVTVTVAANAADGNNRLTPKTLTKASAAHKQTDSNLNIGGALPSGPLLGPWQPRHPGGDDVRNRLPPSKGPVARNN